MRTIKFRGKGKKDGKWYFGNLYDKDTRGRTHICTIEGGCLDIDPSTVGQFTGLYDCNGDAIYEGDIIQSRDFTSSRSEVIWLPKRAAFGFRIYWKDDPDNYILGDWLTFEGTIKVIGNIHDNPELLKGGEK